MAENENIGDSPKEHDQIVNPWEVSAKDGGKIDYDKLIDRFGCQRLDGSFVRRVERLTSRPAHVFLHRGVFFAHRDFNEILDLYERGEKFYLYTGRGPSSEALHLGHLVPFMFTKFFHSANELSDSKCPSTSEFKTKPDGWETTTKVQDGSIWEMSQREEDILVQEFERRIAFSKFQIASFIKSHIFSRRRPIDGWKYMIEEIGPNSKKGKGSVPRLPAVSDPSTQPYAEELQSSPLGGRHKRGR